MNLIIKNIHQLVTVAANGKPFKAGKEMRELNVVENAAVLIENGIIQRIGSTVEFSAPSDIDVLDAGNRVALPGFVDSHTHAVFAGSREHEFALRSDGRSYEEIGASGGGILSTMNATRAATKKELFRSAERR